MEFLSQNGLDRLEAAHRVAVLTGAGVSAESGVPTFRGEEGLWKKFRPEELANFDAFMRNPELVWEWYTFRKNIIANIEPNAGHYTLAKLEPRFPEFALITQNVDGLHRRAGSNNVLELHGNIMRNRCLNCETVIDSEELEFEGTVPRCQCGGMLRPDVVWFGEMLPQRVLHAAFEAAESCDVFFSVGTSAVVHPAASLPIVAKQNDAYLIEINPEATPLTAIADESLRGASGEILPVILKDIEERK
ncbi:NAD-dependent protein deacylase [bacterium SM23_57]|nr:MAG: NAD-dependent protein deacylase [bacterium SM23_57]